MLTLSKPLSAGQAATYYSREFSNAKENYYSEDSEVIGQWRGRLAEAFGLRGNVGHEEFLRLAEGQHPETGQQLIRRLAAHSYVNAKGEQVSTMEHRAGFDATFSAPKSVSLVALVGGDERVREAHRDAVTVALGELEAYTQARLGGKKLPETTGRFVAAVFHHDSARPVDGMPGAPQLHDHCVIFNVSQTSHDRFRSLQPRELYRSQSFATAAYRAELARRLMALGYDIERGTSGEPSIKGISKEYMRATSPRREQIQELLAKHGRAGAAAAQIAALQSRGQKIAHTKDEVQRHHQEMAAAFGHQPQRLVATAMGRTPAIPSAAAGDRAAKDALAFAKDRNMERAAVVDERAVLTDALKRGMGATTVKAVKAEFTRRVDVGELLARSTVPGAASRAWTTPEMVALEQAVIARMHAGQATQPPLASPAIRQAIDRELPHLNADQRAAVQQLLASRDQVVALDGIAGSGKTTTLSAIRVAAERAGYTVQGVAPTSRATHVLAEAGMPAQTLQRYIARAEPPDQRPQLTVLDESSLASTVLMKDFLQRMRPQDRVILVGDVRQHEAVDAGVPYRQLQDAGLQTARLTAIVRQTDPQLRAVVEHLAAGDVRTAVADLTSMGKVHVIEDRTQRFDAVTAAVLAAPKTLVVCPDNQSRQDLNAAIHRGLQAVRTVSPDHEPTRVLVTRQDLTGADRGYADRYTVGDVVRYTKGSQAHGLQAGEYATVVGHDHETNTLTVQRAAGERVTYDPRRLLGVTVYQKEERALAVGDRVQFTAPSRELRVANRELGTIRELAGGQARVDLDDGRQVAFKVADHPHLDLGYAVTSYSGQGLTAERTIVHIDSDRSPESIVNQRLIYVAGSRGRHDLQIFTDNAAALVHNVSRDVSHRSAVEQAPSARKPEHTLALARA
jgi:conjugative relaxase-like TrwC/TraI family protein